MTSETDQQFMDRVDLDLDLKNTADLTRLFALARRGAEMQWRPMWCIPQVTPVLVLLRNGECIVSSGPFAIASKADKVAIYRRDGTFPNAGYMPVGWMPLPPPPKGAEE